MGNYFEKIKIPSLILAADVPFDRRHLKEGETLEQTLKESVDPLANVPQFVAAKIGFLTIVADYTLRQVCDYIHNDAKKLVIFDMQKMGKDIQDVVGKQAALFASVADAVIVDPKGLEYWQKAYDAVEKAGKGLITVLYMTDEKTTLGDRLATTIDICKDVKASGRRLDGVVLPANQPEITKLFRHVLAFYGIEARVFSPGIGAQGGESEIAAEAGTDYGIVGRAITGAQDKLKTSEDIVAALERGYQKRIAGR